MLFKDKELQKVAVSLIGSPRLLAVVITESLKRFGDKIKIDISFQDENYEVGKTVLTFDYNPRLRIYGGLSKKAIGVAQLVFIEKGYKLSQEEGLYINIMESEGGELVEISKPSPLINAATTGKVLHISDKKFTNVCNLCVNTPTDLAEGITDLSTSSKLVYDQEFSLTSQDDLEQILDAKRMLKGTSSYYLVNNTSKELSNLAKKSDLVNIVNGTNKDNYTVYINLVNNGVNYEHLIQAHVTNAINNKTGWMLRKNERNRFEKARKSRI